VLLNPRLVLSGSYDSAGEHLRTIFADNPSNITTDEILRILNLNQMSWFKTPVINLYNKDDLTITTHLNPNSNPGHYFKLLLNPTKGSVLHYSLPIAHTLLEEASMVPTKNLYLWDVLGREKDVKLLNDDGTEVSTRVVLNTEAPCSLLLCNFAQKISIALQRKGIDNKFNTTDEFNQKKYFKYYQNNFKFDYYLDADWKNFDANVDTQFILVAMSILLSGLSTIDDKNMRLSYYVLSSIITKYVAVPPGIVVEVNKSVPSGHPFTTLCNCYVNIIYWSLIGYNIYGENYHEMMDFTVYGDDALVWFKYHENLFKIDDIVKNIGIKSEPLVNSLYPCKLSSQIDDQPDFLKRRFNSLEVKWNTKKMFDRLFYQTKNRSISDQLDLPFSYLVTAPFDDDLFTFCKEFLDYVRIKYFNDIDQTLIDKYQKILDNIITHKERIIDNEVESYESFKKEMDLIKYSTSIYIPRQQVIRLTLNHDKLLFAFFSRFDRGFLNSKREIIDHLLQQLVVSRPPPDTKQFTSINASNYFKKHSFNAGT
jgi:hypothetical protein